jgi:ATP-dependent Clp protease ATP-binding subunit ClpA
MWQRFTERARKVVFYAQEEAGRLGENYVSSQHLLLGLVREDDSVAAKILDRMNISRDAIRAEMEKHITRGDGRLGQDMQLTPGAKRVIDLAYDEARQLNNNYIGTEHLLLALIRERQGVAGILLIKLGVELERARREVRHLQESGEHPHKPTQTPDGKPVAERQVEPFPTRSVVVILGEMLEAQKRIEGKLDQLLKRQEGRRKGGKETGEES